MDVFDSAKAARMRFDCGEFPMNVGGGEVYFFWPSEAGKVQWSWCGCPMTGTCAGIGSPLVRMNWNFACGRLTDTCLMQPRSSSPAYRHTVSPWAIRIASLCLLVVVGALVCFLMLGAVGILMERHELLFVALGSLPVAVVAGLVLLLCGRTSCPLCLNPLFIKRGCSRNSAVGRFLGSRRVRVAFGALLRGRYRCPYCGEWVYCSGASRPQLASTTNSARLPSTTSISPRVPRSARRRVESNSSSTSGTNTRNALKIGSYFQKGTKFLGGVGPLD